MYCYLYFSLLEISPLRWERNYAQINAGLWSKAGIHHSKTSKLKLKPLNLQNNTNIATVKYKMVPINVLRPKLTKVCFLLFIVILISENYAMMSTLDMR